MAVLALIRERRWDKKLQVEWRRGQGRGHRDEAIRLLHSLESFASDVGMIPEQIWDSDDIPELVWFDIPLLA